MPYIIAVILGCAASLATGGNIGNIFNFKIKKLWILLAAFFIQIASQILCYNGFKFFTNNSIIIHGLVFFMLFVVYWFNRHYLGIIAVGAGTVLNALVMMANGGKMPVELKVIPAEVPAEAVQAISSGLDSKHVLIDEATRFAFLSDIIYLPSFFGIWMRVVSIGDLIVVMGIGTLVFEATAGRGIPKAFFSKK
ncbi:MAG: DUF5317 domain-containing protein [Acetivibrionales bacterium]|jgi:hypothetical protein